MPELPEVETIARELRPGLTGRTIISVQVNWPRTVALPQEDVARFAEGLIGRKIAEMGRRGKFILIALDSGSTLIVHLRMSGQLLLAPCGQAEHLRAALKFADDSALYFYDARKFGRLWLTDNAAQVVGDLGPEPLAETFTLQLLIDRFRGRRGMLKPLLLDQRFIAGLGNIYADESLFRAGLHPQRGVDTLNEAEVARLHEAIREVLSQAIEHHGTSFDGAFVRPHGEQGRQQEGLSVYQQADLPCVRCGTPIQRIVVGGRGTYFCPRCQLL